MSNIYRFSEWVGQVIAFDPAADRLEISARSPEEVAITSNGIDVVLATELGAVTLRNMRLDQLNLKNIAFMPLPPVVVAPPVVEPPVVERVVAPVVVQEESTVVEETGVQPANHEMPDMLDLFSLPPKRVVVPEVPQAVLVPEVPMPEPLQAANQTFVEQGFAEEMQYKKEYTGVEDGSSDRVFPLSALMMSADPDDRVFEGYHPGEFVSRYASVQG